MCDLAESTIMVAGEWSRDAWLRYAKTASVSVNAIVDTLNGVGSDDDAEALSHYRQPVPDFSCVGVSPAFRKLSLGL